MNAPLRIATLPPLENGDRLTRAEFERRYEAMPEVKKAELIEGVVHMPSPVRQVQHGKPHSHIQCWLATYSAATAGVEVGNESTLRLDLDNELQPDGLLYIVPEKGGQALIDDDGYLCRAPELVAEVSASTASVDLGDKMQVYRRHGVREYLVWRVLDQAVDWFALREERYERLNPDAAGLLKSVVFPGLWLDPAALLRGDLATVLSVLQQGLASPEHAALVERWR